MVSNQQFRLKWNNHRNTVLQEFETLLHNNSFVDCTIGAEGKYLKAHKIVLSACSPYLQNVFSEHFDKHPVVLLKDVSFKELKCMIDYMYCGEVNISDFELPSFLRTAQSLKIKGLAEDINDYDSGSDNDQPGTSFSDASGRTIEANVEIDEDAPPTKKGTPTLTAANAINSLAVRKRKVSTLVPNAAKIGNQGKVSTSSNTTKSTSEAYVPSSDVENSHSTVTTNENCVNENENNDSIRKNSSQNDTQETTKNRTEVKEEPVDTDADNDDNSSYECMNNPCEDSDPLNEDSESNCANSGGKFNEVSIANVGSFNESDANDGTLKIKEELFSEVTILPNDFEPVPDRLRVRSPSQLLSEEYDPSSYCISENEEDVRNSIIVEVKSITDEDELISEDNVPRKCAVDEFASDGYKSPQRSAGRARKSLHRKCKTFELPPQPRVKRPKSRSRVKYTPVRVKKADKERPKYETNKPFRKILPAPAPLKTPLLPSSLLTCPITSETNSSTSSAATKYSKSTKTFTSAQDILSTSNVTPSASYQMPVVTPSAYQVIKMPSNQQFDVSADLPQVLCQTESVDEFCHSAGIVLNNPGQQLSSSSASSAAELTRLNGSELPGNIFLLNPTSRVMLLNSDVTSDPIYTLTSGNPSTASISSKLTTIPIVQRPNVVNISDISAVIKHTTKVNTTRKKKVPPVVVQQTKFRKIAPLPTTNISQ